MRWIWTSLLGLIVAAFISIHFAFAAPIDAGQEKAQKFDFVVLALSWSPTYCASSAKRGESAQCQNSIHRGFVVHGLWPQALDGARLRCSAGKSEFSKALFERALEVFPDLYLAQSQWQRHGQCFGFSADAYLERTNVAKSKIVVPDRLRALEQPMSLAAEDLRKEFSRANSGLPLDAISVSCRKSALVEVLICMKSDLSTFESCPQIAKRSCRASSMQIPASPIR